MSTRSPEPSSPRLGSRGFDANAALDHLRSKDALLGKAIDDVGPFRLTLTKAPSTFAALAESIVYQQLNGRAAATIFGRVCALLPEARDYIEAEEIMTVPDEALRSAGLSASKLLSIRDLARRTLDGAVPTLRQAAQMSDEDLIERLVEVRGIGQWTAQMFLIFRMGRPDVLALDDYGLRKGFAITFNKHELPSKDDLARRGKRWAPYRSVASWYLWRMAELPFKPQPAKPKTVRPAKG